MSRWPPDVYAHRGVDDLLICKVGREVEGEAVRVSKNWRR